MNKYVKAGIITAGIIVIAVLLALIPDTKLFNRIYHIGIGIVLVGLLYIIVVKMIEK